MRRLTLLLLFAVIACAQTNSVTIRIGTKTWKFDLPVAVKDLQCDKTALAVGESSSCTITLDSPAPAGGFVVTPYSADAPLTLSPASMTVPANSSSIQFVVTRP